jgi:molecular chaperone DnaK (HSP70)
MKMRPLIAGLVLLSLAYPALAQEEDDAGDMADPQCLVSANWRVFLNELTDEPGMTMDLNKRNSAGQPDCASQNVKPEFTVGGTGKALWFTSLAADYLVMSQTTGSASHVIVQNLNDMSIAVDALSNDSQADSWGVTYWEQKEAATAATCPQLADYTDQGFAATIAHEMRYDFATKTILVSGKTSCEPVQ